MTLIEANRIVAFGLLVLIWLVQLVIYPAFADIAIEGFRGWHVRYTRAITWIVAPLMLAQVALAIALVVRHPSIVTIAYSALVAATWLLTALVAVPIHNELGTTGHDVSKIRRLIATNWLRTISWTLAFLVLFL